MYYLLNYTWGILTTLAGWLAYAFISIFLKKYIVERGKFGKAHYIMLGNNWGGFSLGVCFFVANGMSKEWTLHTQKHELGHTYQNAYFGLLMPFLITIPSVIRYWLFNTNLIKGDYESAWFEAQATKLGGKHYGEKSVQ